MVCLRLVQRHAHLYRHRLALHSVPHPPPGLSEPKAPNQPLLQPRPVWAENRQPQATYTQRQGQIQSWTPGAVWTKKRKGNLSQLPQEQGIKPPQSTWCTLHLWNTWIDNESSQIEEVDFGSNDIYIFSPFSLFVTVYVYASVCDFVCIALLLPFVLGFCLSVFFFFLFFSRGFSSCYHRLIGFLVSLLSSFFLFFKLLKKFF